MKDKYTNKLGIIFKNQNFHEKFFDSDDNSLKIIDSFDSQFQLIVPSLEIGRHGGRMRKYRRA